MSHDLANPILRALREEAGTVARGFEDLARGLSDRQLHWRPDASSWSIGQCLEHLVLTGESYERRIWAALTGPGPEKRPGAPVRSGAVGKWLLSVAGPEAGRRRLACPAVLAPEATPQVGVLERFLAGQRLLASFIDGADGLDLNARRVRVPGGGFLRVGLGEALQLATGHTRRHLTQAQRVRAHPEFPA